MPMLKRIFVKCKPSKKGTLAPAKTLAPTMIFLNMENLLPMIFSGSDL